MPDSTPPLASDPTPADPPWPVAPPAGSETGWALPTGAPPSGSAGTKPARRATLAVSWVAGLLLAGFGGWLAMRAAEGGTAYRWGIAFGATFTPFLIAALLRFAYVKLRGGGRPVLRSPWIPLGGALLAAVTAAGALSSLAPAAPVDATTGMHVRTPFTLREADSATSQQIEQAVRKDPSVRSVAVREVVGGDGSVSVLMAADARMREGGIDEIAKGMQDSSGVEPTIFTIGGEEVAIVTGPQGSIGTWVEAPLLFSVFAPDTATLHAVIEAVTGSG
jgi:hypothetical protein